jgi:hypothetical protein
MVVLVKNNNYYNLLLVNLLYSVIENNNFSFITVSIQGEKLDIS